MVLLSLAVVLLSVVWVLTVIACATMARALYKLSLNQANMLEANTYRDEGMANLIRSVDAHTETLDSQNKAIRALSVDGHQKLAQSNPPTVPRSSNRTASRRKNEENQADNKENPANSGDKSRHREKVTNKDQDEADNK